MSRRFLILIGAVVIVGAVWLGVYSPPIFLGSPDFVLGPNSQAPLAGYLSARTSKPTIATVELSIDGQQLQLPMSSTYRYQHHWPVAGLLLANSYYDVEATILIRDKAGNATRQNYTIGVSTPALPADFPPLEVGFAQPELMEPGVTLFNALRWAEGKMDEDVGWIIAVNAQGEVVWFYRDNAQILDVIQARNGNLVFISGDTGLKEIDIMGNVVNHWQATRLNSSLADTALPVDIDTIHHEIIELQSGNFLTLATALRPIENFPMSDELPDGPTTTTQVVDDIIVEFERDGSIAKTWSLLDILDPHRIGYDSVMPFWNRLYPEVKEGTSDWAHSNGIAYDPSDDSMIVSARHQDAVVKIRRNDGGIAWILGSHDNWQTPWSDALLDPVGEVMWPYHQHAPTLTPRGTLLLFDNGNYRASPFAPKQAARSSFSRAVEYEINEDNRTVAEVWHYGGDDSEIFYSPFVGDVDWLPLTDHVLITDGGRTVDTEGLPTNAVNQGHHWGRIIEVTHEANPQKVFELTIGDTSPDSAGWTVYRSERIPLFKR